MDNKRKLDSTTETLKKRKTECDSESTPKRTPQQRLNDLFDGNFAREILGQGVFDFIEGELNDEQWVRLAFDFLN